MIPVCVNCGLALPLRGGHECVVNKTVNKSDTTVNKTVNAKKKRGAYPNTDARRAYMRELMRKRRAGIK